MRVLSEPDTLTPIFPQTGAGSPGFFVSSVHLVPPSVVLKSPVPGPPLESEYGVRNTSHSPTYSTSGLFGSIARSTATVLSSRNSTRSHVLPPSFVRKTPRSEFGPYASPSAATYATSGFVG